MPGKGIWRIHEVFDSGREWGEAVRALAKSYPGAVAEHIAALTQE